MGNAKLSCFALLVCATAACQQTDDNNNIAIDNEVNAAEVANADIESLPPSEGGGEPVDLNSGSDSAANGADNASGSEISAVIPAQYRGRWGMVAADCTSTRGDAKGLMTIGESSIRFYESLATLKQQRPAIATSFSGLYGYTGEGQTWEKVVTLTRTGDTLRRADDEGRYSYQRCA